MWLDYLRQDVRYALRSFRRAPLFAATAVVSIAIGVAADTAVFTVVNAVFFRPPAGVTEPESLVDISARRGRGFGIEQISWPTTSI